jgi:hypothetical protein
MSCGRPKSLVLGIHRWNWHLRWQCRFNLFFSQYALGVPWIKQNSLRSVSDHGEFSSVGLLHHLNKYQFLIKIDSR